MARMHWVQPKFWRSFWFALRRAKFDPKARQNLQRLALYLVVIFAVFFIQILRFSALGTAAFAIALLIFPLIAVIPVTIYIIQITYRFIRSRIERVKSFRQAEKTPEKSEYIFRACYEISVLLDRLGSERAMEKELPPEIEVITRRVHFDKLKERNFRDQLRPWMLDLLLAPDGSWSEEQKQRIQLLWDVFVVLRWLMFMGEFEHVSKRSKYNYNDVRATLQLLDAGHVKLRPVWDIRLQRDITQSFFNRVWMESVARGMFTAQNEQQKSNLLNARSRYVEAGYTGDYLIGIHTVAELPNDFVWYLGRKSYLRARTLAVLVDILSGDQPCELFETFMEAEFSPRPSTVPVDEVKDNNESRSDALI